MNEIILGKGGYAVTSGFYKGMPSIIIEKVKVGVVGEKADDAIADGEKTVISFENYESALVLIEQVAKSQLP